MLIGPLFACIFFVPIQKPECVVISVILAFTIFHFEAKSKEQVMEMETNALKHL